MNKKSLYFIVVLSMLASVSTFAMRAEENITTGDYSCMIPVRKQSAKKSVTIKKVESNQPIPTQIKIGMSLKQVARMNGVEFRVSLSAKGYMLTVAHDGTEWTTNVSWNSEKGLTASGKKKVNVDIVDDYTVVKLTSADFNNLAKVDGEW